MPFLEVLGKIRLSLVSELLAAELKSILSR